MLFEGTFKHLPSTKPTSSNDASGKGSILPDTELWRAFKSGDEAAFIQLYNQFAGPLFNYGCQFCQDREMVKDCLQDFFIYLRKNRSGFNDTAFIKMYLFKAFRRRIVDYLRKHRKERQHSGESLYFQFPVELSSENIYIDNQFEEQQIRRLNDALNALDAKEREAIYYFYFQGLGYEQIAEIFNFSHVSSARRLMYRGLAQLRKLIGILMLIAFSF
jgi:RNA polymerase sigma factor (sigma-70 family)